MPSARSTAGAASRRVRGLVRRARQQLTGGRRSGLARAAHARGLRERDLRAVLDRLDLALDEGTRPPRLAVLVGPDSPDWAALVLSCHPQAHVVVVDPRTADPATTHARLAARGRLHALVDDTGDRTGAWVEELERMFLHLRPEGVLLVRGADVGRAPWADLARSVGDRPDDAPRARTGFGWRAFPEAVGTVERGRGHVVLANRLRGFAKLTEAQMDLVIAERSTRAAEVLVELPAQDFASRCELRENTDERSAGMPEAFSVPAMSLRVYRDVWCAPRQVAVQRNIVLPDTYRFNAADQLQNIFLPNLGPLFAEPDRPVTRGKRLEGSYFYLDSEWTGHFGHAMTEQLSRLWAVAEARRAMPDLKALVSRRRGRPRQIAEYEREIFGAAGFAEQDIVLHKGPVRVERLVAASPMWVLPTHVHPQIADLWHDLGARLEARAPDGVYPELIFCSRRLARRGCKNLGEVEALFESFGFTVVYPEDMPFVAQVRMFRSARVIAGFAGSGMFTAQFCATPRHVIALGPTSYPSRNEYLICAAAGHRLDHVWSEPDPVEVAGDKPQYAGFTFDMEREGRFLREVLADL